MNSIAIVLLLVLLSIGLQAKHIPGHVDSERARRQFFGAQNAKNIQNNQFSAPETGARPADDDDGAGSELSQADGARGKLELSGESNSFSHGSVRKTNFQSADGAVQGFSKQTSAVSASSTSFTGRVRGQQAGSSLRAHNMQIEDAASVAQEGQDSSVAQSGVVESSQRIRNNQQAVSQQSSQVNSNAVNSQSVVSNNRNVVESQVGEVQQSGAISGQSFAARKNKINQASVVSTDAVEQSGLEHQQISSNRNRVVSSSHGNFEASRFNPQASVSEQSELVSGQRIRNNQVVSQQTGQVNSGFESGQFQQSGQVVSGKKVIKHKKVQQQQSTSVNSNVESEQVNSQSVVSGHRFANKNTVNNQAVVSSSETVDVSRVNQAASNQATLVSGNAQVVSGQRIRNNQVVSQQSSQINSNVGEVGEVQQSGAISGQSFAARRNKINQASVVSQTNSNVESAVSGEVQQSGFAARKNKINHGTVVVEQSGFESSQQQQVNRNRVVSGTTRKTVQANSAFESNQQSEESVSGQRIRNNNQATLVSGSGVEANSNLNSEVTEAQSGVVSGHPFRGGIHPNIVSGHTHVRPGGFEGRFDQGPAGFDGRFGQGPAGFHGRFEGRFGQGLPLPAGGFASVRAGPVFMEARQGNFGGRKSFFSEVSSDNFGKLGNTGNFF